MIKAYIVFRLMLNAATGEPLELTRMTEAYATFDECAMSLADRGVQHPVDGRVAVYTCGKLKEITTL